MADDAQEAMNRFLAECEAMPAIELEAFLKRTRLSATWRIGANDTYQRKIVEEALAREREGSEHIRRQTAAAESQAISAEKANEIAASANRKSSWALGISFVALIVAVGEATLKGLGLLP